MRWLAASLLACVVACTSAPPSQPQPSAEQPAPAVEPTPTRGPTAQLAINPQPAPQSGQVQISGTGFGPNEQVSISVAETENAMLPLGTATTQPDGAFPATALTLPDQLMSGSHALRAIGQTSARLSTGTLWIRAPQPWLVLDSYDVPQYGDLGLVAGGFQPMDQVQVSLAPPSGEAVQLTSFDTDQAGNGQWLQTKLPRTQAGTFNLVLRGVADTSELRREVHITPLKPVVELSPWAGPPGLPVQVNVRGFAPGERVQISAGMSTASVVTANADEYGDLWGAGPVRIPQNAEAGAVTLNLKGDDSGATASAEFKVLPPKPWLELTNWFGAPGAPVGFGGGGWIAGERVTVHMGSATNAAIAETVTDDGGWLKGAAQIYIPLDVNDNVMFVAVGDQSHLICAATFTVVFPFGLHPQATPSAGR
jgi:hypothetical protein